VHVLDVKNKWDIIIVGAGPAGSAAGYTLAKKGFDVLILERGRQPGYKELFGGRVYAEPLREIYGNDLEKAPIHRWVKREKLSFVDGNKLLSIEYQSDTSTSFTTYLPQLARWMADKASEAGALVVEEVTVDRILYKDGKVIGVGSGSDEVYADLVIDAEGVNRLLLEGLGLVEKLKPEQVAVGAKETIKLGENKINERFGLDKGEGMAWLLMGGITDYIPGGAFIYTNKDSVSIGLVLHLGHAINEVKDHISQMVEKLRLHPQLRNLWIDGDIMEYGGHLTPEAGPAMMPKKLALNGFLITGDAGGLLLNVGYTIRGVDFAAYTGYLAAKATMEAHDNGGFTEQNLKAYERMLKNSFVYKDLTRLTGMQDLYNDPEMFKALPKLAVNTAANVFEIGLETPGVWNSFNKARKEARLGLLSLAWKGYRLMKKM